MPAGRRAVLALLAALAISTVASAQFPGGQGGSRGGMGGREGRAPEAARGAPAADASSSANALVLTQLDQLEDDLRLAAAQRSAWDAYADTVLKLADNVTRLRFEARTSTPAPASAPEQLDQIASGVRSRTAIVDQIVESGRALYATLRPEQKAIADRRLALPLSLLATGVAPAAWADGGGRSGRGRNP